MTRASVARCRLTLVRGDGAPGMSVPIAVAATCWRRLLGLMWRHDMPAGCDGLLLTRCAGVHTAWMRFAIDVVHVDADGVVTAVVPNLGPWRTSRAWSWTQGFRVRHVLELRAGGAAALGLVPGSRLRLPLGAAPARPPGGRSRGSAMVEFLVVAPLLTFLGLALIQYGLLYFARDVMDQAAFLAARAGSVGHAQLAAMEGSYAAGMTPLYMHGHDPAALSDAEARALADVQANTLVRVLNPTRGAFDDWNDAELQVSEGRGLEVIPNAGLAFSDATRLGPRSGQTLRDANVLRLRIVQGIEPIVPLVGSAMVEAMRLADPRDGSAEGRFRTAELALGRIPIAVGATVQMQSDAIASQAIEP